MGKEKKELCIDYTYYETVVPDSYEKRPGSRKQDPCEVRAFIPGTVIEIKVHEGQQVSAGQELLVLEAMKMYNDVEAEASGRVAEISVSEGESVEKNQLLVRIEK